jgi:hypothetical protein
MRKSKKDNIAAPSPRSASPPLISRNISRSNFALQGTSWVEEIQNEFALVRAPYLNIVTIIVIAAITSAASAIQFAHRTSLRLTSESHLLRARCRLSLLALRNINVTRSIRTHYTARSEGMGRGNFRVNLRRGNPAPSSQQFWPPGGGSSNDQIKSQADGG